ncbi:MAG: hypothetical protein WA777_15670 [Rhodanobacter sp.]
MANDLPKTELQLITDAVGAHGVYFKKALRGKLEGMAGVKILGEEYPVRYLEGASIDLLVEFTGEHARFVIPIECKRALASAKTWIFFKDEHSEVKLFYSFIDAGLNAKTSRFVELNSPICVEGVEVDSTKLRNPKGPYSAASADNIWKAAFQACKGGLGFVMSELQTRQKIATPVFKLGISNFHVFLLVVTTAPLKVAELPAGSVDPATGLHVGDLSLQDVPWLTLHYPFTPATSPGSNHLEINTPNYQDPFQRGLHGKEGIIFVNVQHIERFFELLRVQRPT